MKDYCRQTVFQSCTKSVLSRIGTGTVARPPQQSSSMTHQDRGIQSIHTTWILLKCHSFHPVVSCYECCNLVSKKSTRLFRLPCTSNWNGKRPTAVFPMSHILAQMLRVQNEFPDQRIPRSLSRLIVWCDYRVRHILIH